MKRSNAYLSLGLLVTVLVFIAGNAMADTPAPPPIPDAASTSLLLGITAMGLTAIKRCFRR